MNRQLSPYRSSFDFLGLPAELRNSIFRLSLVEPKDNMHRQLTLANLPKVGPAAKQSERKLVQPALAFVCRQIRIESLDLFYYENEFHEYEERFHSAHTAMLPRCPSIRFLRGMTTLFPSNRRFQDYRICAGRIGVHIRLSDDRNYLRIRLQGTDLSKELIEQKAPGLWPEYDEGKVPLNGFDVVNMGNNFPAGGVMTLGQGWCAVC
ncbi:hypothetical protein M501DRAFT_998705 [Patellaria atrata CBS 101060]|uniref:Uncharacterized protein n=1 Tax=Patellaria atrata CBS 101060 TaxID=1346257 RepID=A0A9P4SGC5_9PEZI|nr:hypothetical protein M501DRAFT_998705 [Patellaria atrata CBS 101060]